MLWLVSPASAFATGIVVPVNDSLSAEAGVISIDLEIHPTAPWSVLVSEL
jgi:hypothetical protein